MPPSGYAGDALSAGVPEIPLSGAPQRVSWRCPSVGILLHFVCRDRFLQRSAALCVQGSRSTARCRALSAGVTFWSALLHFVCRGGGVVFSAVILEMPLGGCPGDVPQRASSRHLGVPLSGYPGDALSAGMLEIPLGGILEMPLSGYPAALCVQGSRCPLWQERPGSGHPGDAPSSPGVYGIRLGHEKQHKS